MQTELSGMSRRAGGSGPGDAFARDVAATALVLAVANAIILTASPVN